MLLCELKYFELISSEVLIFEINCIPDYERKEDALAILKIAYDTLDLSSEVERVTRGFENMGLKVLDALHLAFAFVLKVDYFCICDDKFLKKAKKLKH